MRFLTITLNAAIDTTYVLEQLPRGGIARVLRKLAVPGGKGNNVARVLARLGRRVTASGYIGGWTGRFIEQGLQAEGIMTAMLEVPGESRICLSLVEQSAGTTSEIREQGLHISAEHAQAFIRLAARLADAADCVVLSGSLPPGLPRSFYAELLAALRPAARLLAFDSSGEALRLGLTARPDLIKPNLDEIADLMGQRCTPEEAVRWVQQALLGSVLDDQAHVLLSLGAAGALLITRQQAIRAHAPVLEAVNPVGCGDALLAGYLSALADSAGPDQALREAVAVGSAAALQEAPGVVELADVARLRPLVRLALHERSII